VRKNGLPDPAEHIGLVRYVISRYYGHCIKQGVPIEDMDEFQDGCTGLMRAVERYDVTFGTKFSTYAVPWIRRGVQEGQMRLRPHGAKTAGSKRFGQNGVSFTDYVGNLDEKGSPLKDALLSVTDEVARFEQVEHEENIVQKALGVLSPKEQMFAKAYIFDGKTLEQIGDEAGISKERVRQILARAKRKMKVALEC